MSRTIAGRDFSADVHFWGNRTPANVLALSETGTKAPAVGENDWGALGGRPGNELTTDGMGRKVAVYIHTAGTRVVSLQRSFTHSGPPGGGEQRVVRQVGVFAPSTAHRAGAPDSGTLVFVLDEEQYLPLFGTDALNQVVSVDLGA